MITFKLPVIMYAPDNDTGAGPLVIKKTASELAAEEREKIEVTKPNKVEDDVEEEKELEAKDDDEQDKEDGKEEEKKEDKEGEGKDEDVEETKTKSVEKLERTILRLQKRLDKETGSKKDLAKELNDAKIKLEEKKIEGEVTLTEKDVEERAKQLASETVANTEFVKSCNRLADQATKVDKDFDKKVKAMAEDIGAIPSVMIGMLDDLDNGGAVLAYLADNVEDAEEIYVLPLSKMSIRLAKLSDKIEREKKPKKEISNVPAPNAPIGGGNSSPTILSDKEPMNDWVRKRNQQVEDRRKAKLGGMR